MPAAKVAAVRRAGVAGTRASSVAARAMRATGVARTTVAWWATMALAAACGGDPLAPSGATPLANSAPLTFAALLDSIRREDQLPALGAAIITSDSVLRLEAVGVRRFGGTTSVTRDDRWHLGSVLKHQVSALVARLVAEGALSWSATMSDYFPELVPTMRSEYRTRTLRDLLSHSAGLPRDYTTGVTATGRVARESAAQWALQAPPAATPGTYAYSNVGYMVAGAIIERTLNRDFEQVIAERLWAPLGMTTAGFGQAGTPGLDDQPLGHRLAGGATPTIFDAGHPNADNPPEYSPAGRAHMSLRDWARFTAALLSAERGRDTPVLSSGAWRALTAGHVANGSGSYGYGLVVADRSWASGRALFHNGTNTRHYALVGIAPGQDFAILIASNQWSQTMDVTMDRIFGRLANFHLTGR